MRAMLRRVLAAWCGLFLAAPGASVELHAREPTRRVVLLEGEPALERALSTALGPWGMALSRAPDGVAEALPLGSEQAAALARRMRADALVWLELSARERKLWVYDGDSGVLSARDVPSTLDETRAAALALSVKTELRPTGLESEDAADAEWSTSSGAAPSESVAAESVVAQSVPPGMAPSGTNAASAASASVSAAPQDQPSSERSEAHEPPRAAERDVDAPPQSIDAPSARESASERLVPERRLSLLAHAALRTGATSRTSVEQRYAAEMRWQLHAARQAEVWAGARLDLGPSEALATPVFSGSYSELGGGLELGAALHVTSWFAVGAHVAASLYAGTLSGTRAADAAEVGTTHFGYTLQLRPEMELSGGRMGLLIQPALAAAPFRQLYEVNGAPVLELHPVWWQLGAAVRVDLD